ALVSRALASEPHQAQLRQALLELRDRRHRSAQRLLRLVQGFPCENARLRLPARPPRQDFRTPQKRSQTHQKRAAERAGLLSYLAQPPPQPPTPLVIRLPLTERHHHVLVVGAVHVRIRRVPRATPLAVPLSLAPGGTAGHLTITNSWIRTVRLRTLAEAAAGRLLFHPGMVTGKHSTPRLLDRWALGATTVVGHFPRADPGQFSRASKPGVAWVPAPGKSASEAPFCGSTGLS